MPNNKKRTDTLIELTLRGLQKKYLIVGREQVRAWHALLTLGFAVGTLTGVILISNRSLELDVSQAKTIITAKDLALRSWNFIEGPVFQEDKRNGSNFWVSRFDCNGTGCKIDNFSKEGGYVLPNVYPSLYLENLELLYKKTSNNQYRKRDLVETLFISNLCSNTVSGKGCLQNLTPLFDEARTAGVDFSKSEKMKFLLIPEVSHRPTTPLGELERLKKFIAFAKWTRDPRHIKFVKKIIEDGQSFSEKGALVYQYTRLNFIQKFIPRHAQPVEIYANSCYKPLASLKVYSLVREIKFLDSARNFVDNADLGNNVSSFNKPAVFEGTLLHPGLVCSDLLVSLWEATNEKKYLLEAQKFIQFFTANNIDLPERQIVNGDGAFSRVYSDKEIWKHSIDTLSWTNILLRSGSNVVFSSPLAKQKLYLNLVNIAKADDDDDDDDDDGSDDDGSDDSDDGDDGEGSEDNDESTDDDEDEGEEDDEEGDEGEEDEGEEDTEEDETEESEEENEEESEVEEDIEEDFEEFEEEEIEEVLDITEPEFSEYEIEVATTEFFDLAEQFEELITEELAEINAMIETLPSPSPLESLNSSPSITAALAEIQQSIAQDFVSSVLGPNSPQIDFNSPGWGLNNQQAQEVAQAAIEALGFTPESFASNITEGLEMAMSEGLIDQETFNAAVEQLNSTFDSNSEAENNDDDDRRKSRRERRDRERNRD